MNIVLWIVQGLVALAFLLAGFMKTFMPVETLKKNMAWVSAVPAAFVRFIGIAEMLGAIGLILPAATGIAPWLTIVAAIGLVVVMVSASVFHASRRETSNIGMNVVLLLLALLIVVGRLTFAPLA
jgi:putative oxidoreductase